MRQRCLRAAVLTLTVFAMATVPAHAHYSEARLDQWAFYGQPICVNAGVLQDHAHHRVGTYPTTECSPYAHTYLEANRIADFIAYYKTRQWGTPGEACGYLGWNVNTVRDYRLFHGHSWDIWDTGCNYGTGVNVWLSIDTWHYADRYGNGGWVGRSFNPATKHCHCP
ncbi:MAG: hypothetical protein ACRD12_19300 [Acidimicrobiales bacterium]